MKFQVSNNTLTIKSVSPADEGEVSCYARNNLGEAVDHIGLFIGTPPSFIQTPRGNTPKKGPGLNRDWGACRVW